jgi:hypothetical protein
VEPKDPRTLSDDELERRLREQAHERHNAELWVRREANGDWAVGFAHTRPRSPRPT